MLLGVPYAAPLRSSPTSRYETLASRHRLRRNTPSGKHHRSSAGSGHGNIVPARVTSKPNRICNSERPAEPSHLHEPVPSKWAVQCAKGSNFKLSLARCRLSQFWKPIEIFDCWTWYLARVKWSKVTGFGVDCARTETAAVWAVDCCTPGSPSLLSGP